MQIKLIVAGAAIALIAGVGSVSADENDVAGTAVTRGGTFALLDGIATDTMSIHELAATRGAGSPDYSFFTRYGFGDPGLEAHPVEVDKNFIVTFPPI